MSIWVIQNKEHEDFYWDSNYGWIEPRTPALYDKEAKREMPLPPQGKWVELKEEKP